jgi:hypothetical protein
MIFIFIFIFVSKHLLALERKSLIQPIRDFLNYGVTAAAGCFFCAGEGYWTNDHLVDQLLEVLPIFEEYHPNWELLLLLITVRIIMLCPRMDLLSIE